MTFIYCPVCEKPQPMLIHPMGVDDVTGVFTNAIDWQCGACKLVIATTYEKKA